jgi:hypothetical protein
MDDPVYGSLTVQKWHQLVIQYGVESKDDQNYDWMKNFLRRYFFFEEGRIGGIARSSASGPRAKFVDIIFFLKEASTDLEFPGFI